jgi:hypothetical protein
MWQGRYSFTPWPHYPRRRYRSGHWIGGWVGGPRAGLDSAKKKNLLSLRETNIGHQAHSPLLDLSWLPRLCCTGAKHGTWLKMAVKASRDETRRALQPWTKQWRWIAVLYELHALGSFRILSLVQTKLFVVTFLFFSYAWDPTRSGPCQTEEMPALFALQSKISCELTRSGHRVTFSGRFVYDSQHSAPSRHGPPG